ncbi:MAG: hypothetical protein ACOXZK_08855 [Bacteroidales bacterium]|jgi:hypothetical protein|nr:hypothetical protein [Bacteroidales bacterium]
MLEFEIKRLLLIYFKLHQNLEKNGGVQADGDLFHQITQYEKRILKKFGLPQSNKYVKMMWKIADSKTTLKNKNSLMLEQLSIEAEKYLASKPSSIQQIIKDARKNNLDPFDILPEIYVGPNSYTLFLYNEILLKTSELDNEILEEFSRIKNNGCLMDIYMLTMMDLYKNSEAYKKLKLYGLKFIDAYIIWYRSKKESKEKIVLQEVNKNDDERVEDALVMLIFAFRRFQKFRNWGYGENNARSLSGLTDDKLFKIAKFAFAINS